MPSWFSKRVKNLKLKLSELVKSNDTVTVSDTNGNDSDNSNGSQNIRNRLTHPWNKDVKNANRDFSRYREYPPVVSSDYANHNADDNNVGTMITSDRKQCNICALENNASIDADCDNNLVLTKCEFLLPILECNLILKLKLP